METIDVLIVDDHQMFREGLKAVLEPESGIRVVGEAENGARAIEACERLTPGVVLMDVTMPEMNGIIACNLIKKRCPGTKVLMLSMHLKETYILEALKGGASGYVLKDDAAEELVLALCTVASGERYLSPRIVTMVVERLLSANPDSNPLFGLLSDRELEILQHLCEGKSTRQTAESLVISTRTVENHRAKIMDKLGIHDVPTLVKTAIEAGLIEV
jgi:DNA-binding NarL/FixJ family response regulator